MSNLPSTWVSPSTPSSGGNSAPSPRPSVSSSYGGSSSGYSSYDGGSRGYSSGGGYSSAGFNDVPMSTSTGPDGFKFTKPSAITQHAQRAAAPAYGDQSYSRADMGTDWGSQRQDNFGLEQQRDPDYGSRPAVGTRQREDNDGVVVRKDDGAAKPAERRNENNRPAEKEEGYKSRNREADDFFLKWGQHFLTHQELKKQNKYQREWHYICYTLYAVVFPAIGVTGMHQGNFLKFKFLEGKRITQIGATVLFGWVTAAFTHIYKDSRRIDQLDDKYIEFLRDNEIRPFGIQIYKGYDSVTQGLLLPRDARHRFNPRRSYSLNQQ